MKVQFRSAEHQPASFAPFQRDGFLEAARTVPQEDSRLTASLQGDSQIGMDKDAKGSREARVILQSKISSGEKLEYLSVGYSGLNRQ
jgi:hypothetical protein